MPSRVLPGIGLNGFWGLGEQWKAGGDENWLKLSVLTQLVVESITDPLPSSPSDGYIAVVPSGTDAGKVAVRDNGEWVYLPVPAGTRAWVKDENIQAVFDGTDWIKPMYGQSNIVGTVSQVAGVPTGAVIERGSNSNGEYVRFADGTQICWVHMEVSDQAINTPYGSVYQGSRTWPYPAAFAERPSVACSLFRWGTGASIGGVAATPSTSSATLRGIDFISRASGTNTAISAIAVGRWFV